MGKADKEATGVKPPEEKPPEVKPPEAKPPEAVKAWDGILRFKNQAGQTIMQDRRLVQNIVAEKLRIPPTLTAADPETAEFIKSHQEACTDSMAAIRKMFGKP